MTTEQPSYRAVLNTEHTARSFLPSILGRLSLATSGLALVLLLEQSTGSFAVAGAVTATLGIANVVATPWRARLIDRRGQTMTLAVLGLTHTLSLIALGLAGNAGLPILLGLSVIAGASSPPFGATMRVLWSAALPAGGMRTRGFSLDAVAEEVTFAVGPLAAALLAVIIDPFASLLLSAACVAIGTTLFVTSPLSRRQLGTHHTDYANALPTRSPLRSRGFTPVVITMIAPGVILGSIEIAAPAVAESESNTLLSGVLLALFAGASALGGLLYGRMRLQAVLERQLLVLALAPLIITAIMGLIGGPLAALIGFTLSGLCLAPQLIVGYLAADERTDPRSRTEASSWINTAVNFGAALGAVIFGATTDSTGPGPALAISAVIASVILAICTPFLLRLRHADQPE
ncbi:MFS transporter [uncultured Arthrobacter sp.]|uniref:MFS transporter n=1 Tax=uncultured Arthrobacter sp. TaxID=114050 RepID=UPI00261D6DB1|nr:MFS transporter [uncultured Arthrobacter sp.]